MIFAWGRQAREIWLLACCVALGSQACTGNIPQEWQRSGTAGGSDTGDVRSDLGRVDVVPMRRLTTTQYQNSVADVFAGKVVAPTLGVHDLSVNGLPTAGAASVSMPATDAEAFTTAAANVAQQAVALGLRPGYSCQPSGVDDSTCLGQIIATYGRKLYRRPLSDAQHAAYLTLTLQQAAAAGDPWQGLAAGFAAMLQSPYFLFRIDTTQQPSVDAGRWDAYTLASRLSYLIWNSTPDDVLLYSAASGALLRPEGLAAQADRLLQDPRANTGLFEFFAETLQLDGIDSAQKDPNDYTATLRAELSEQVNLTVTDLLLTTNSDYRTLFTSQAVFVNADLAARYGYPAPSAPGFTKINYAANDRAGLFGLPGITTMLSPSNRSSPTKRGAFIRQALMCTAIPSPPATVNTTVAADPGNPRTMRQIMSQHATNAECSGCHMLMDPLGFALDDFDWLGNYRTSEVGLPLDLSGSVNGQSFVNARTFGQALANDPQVADCLAQRFILYATASATASQSALEAQLLQSFVVAGYRFKDLVRAYVTSEAFSRAVAL